MLTIYWNHFSLSTLGIMCLYIYIYIRVLFMILDYFLTVGLDKVPYVHIYIYIISTGYRPLVYAGSIQSASRLAQALLVDLHQPLRLVGPTSNQHRVLAVGAWRYIMKAMKWREIGCATRVICFGNRCILDKLVLFSTFMSELNGHKSYVPLLVHFCICRPWTILV